MIKTLLAGKVMKVNKRDIRSQQILEISRMPPGLVNTLAVAEFASLLAYLESLR